MTYRAFPEIKQMIKFSMMPSLLARDLAVYSKSQQSHHQLYRYFKAELQDCINT